MIKSESEFPGRWAGNISRWGNGCGFARGLEGGRLLFRFENLKSGRIVAAFFRCILSLISLATRQSFALADNLFFFRVWYLGFPEVRAKLSKELRSNLIDLNVLRYTMLPSNIYI